jgi:hypothetical protein
VPDLHFHVEEIHPIRNAASPQLAFKLRITNRNPNEHVHSIALRCQVQIEPVRRRYTLEEKERMRELFGEPERWNQTIHPLLWENVNVNVPGFSGSTVVDVPVSCTFDFNVAVTQYIYGLEDGDIPTTLLFSGIVFHAGRLGIQIAPIPLDREASYRVPIRVWKDLIDTFYPNSVWLWLRRDVFDRLRRFRSGEGATSWDQAIERLLALVTEVKHESRAH